MPNAADPLTNARSLNEALMGIHDEKVCAALIKREQRGKARPSLIHRIHCRLNLLRAQRERLELQVK